MTWDEAVRRYARLVMSIPIRFGLSEEDAEDVLQSTWQTALSKRALPPPGDEIVPWLVAIAFWTTRSFVRDARRLPALRDDLDALAGLRTEPPAEVLQRAEHEQAVRDALAALAPRDRRLVTELFLAPTPLSYADVAELIGVAGGSVGALRARALARLQRELTARGIIS